MEVKGYQSKGPPNMGFVSLWFCSTPNRARGPQKKTSLPRSKRARDQLMRLETRAREEQEENALFEVDAVRLRIL